MGKAGEKLGINAPLEKVEKGRGFGLFVLVQVILVRRRNGEFGYRWKLLLHFLTRHTLQSVISN